MHGINDKYLVTEKAIDCLNYSMFEWSNSDEWNSIVETFFIDLFVLNLLNGCIYVYNPAHPNKTSIHFSLISTKMTNKNTWALRKTFSWCNKRVHMMHHCNWAVFTVHCSWMNDINNKHYRKSLPAQTFRLIEMMRPNNTNWMLQTILFILLWIGVSVAPYLLVHAEAASSLCSYFDEKNALYKAFETFFLSFNR